MTAPVRQFGIISSLYEQVRHGIQPGPANHNPHTMEMTETELMDEDAHELQTMILNNPFDLEIFGGDSTTIRNFGTVDNPVLMFSANVGWRYVQCAGMNEDEEGSQHAPVWFILREGPIHRCPHCGQCFKLVNLKDYVCPENDYYLEHYMPVLETEMGDDDDYVTRWTFHNFAEQTPSIYPMQNTNSAYILVNADDHDRILTDPAYRMQKLQEGHEKLHDVHLALIEVENRRLYELGGYYPKVQFTCEDYQDLVTAETAIRKLDRIRDKIVKFNKRAILNPAQHERREARMNDRALTRTVGGLVNLVGTNELELKYNDYYESEIDPEEEVMAEMEDYEELFASGKFNFKNYEFIEDGLSNPVPALMSTFEKKVFRFRHRKWQGDVASHYIRENRMILRHLDRLQQRSDEAEIDQEKLLEIYKKQGKTAAYEYAEPYREWVMTEAVNQYKDYFESDPEDLDEFEFMVPSERATIGAIYKDYSRPMGELKFASRIETFKWNDQVSNVQNLGDHLRDLRNRILPEVDAAATKGASKYVGPFGKGKEFKFFEGTVTKEKVDLEDVFAGYTELLDAKYAPYDAKNNKGIK